MKLISCNFSYGRIEKVKLVPKLLCNFSYGRIEKVKLVPKRGAEESVSAVIAFVDIRSAQHVQNSSNVYEDRQLRITYSDPAGMG